jgi:fibronectin type III domain protein
MHNGATNALFAGAGPRSTTKIGNATDVSAQVTDHISEAVGSFDSVTGVTSESGTSPINGQSNVANAFSLQLNSNLFSTPLCNGATDASQCHGWQQFIFSSSYAKAFIQYWLVNYATTCPAGWTTSGPNCFKNSSGSVSVPAQPITKLSALSVGGQTTSGGFLGVSDTLYSFPDDNVFNLAAGWDTAEFNVFGDGGGTEATFNNGATIVVRTSVDHSSQNAPSCYDGGFTLETNNLNFASEPSARQGRFPAVVFTESTAGTTSSACASATEVAGGTPPPAPVAMMPTNLVCDSFDLHWKASAGATGYFLDMANDSQFTRWVYNDIDLKNNLAAYPSGMPPGTTYYYRVRAYNASGISGNSNFIDFATPPAAPAPSLPNALTAINVGTTSFNAVWNVPDDAAGIRLDVATDSSFTHFVDNLGNFGLGRRSGIEVQGLSPNTTYYYRVRAYSLCFEGQWQTPTTNSNTIAVTTLAH